MLTNILLIGVIILLILILIFGYIIIIKKLFPYLEEKNKLKSKEISNRKTEIYLSVPLDVVNKELDEYFQRYVNRYIAYKFVANKMTFINNDDTETMIKDLSKLIIIEMSELYLNYIKLVTAINTDEDYIRYIHSRVQNVVIENVSSFNKAQIL